MKSAEERLDSAVRVAGGAPAQDATLQLIRRASLEELKAVPTARPWWVDAAAVLVLNVVMGVGAAGLLSWSSVQHSSVTMRSLVALGWLLVMALGSVLWLKPSALGARWAVGALFAAASLLAVLGASGFDPGAPFLKGMGCAFTECALAAVPVAVVLWLSTRFAARPSHIFAGTLAAASGGVLALHLHCSNGTVAHLGVFHLLPALVLGVLASVFRRFLRPRAFVP